MTIKIIVSVFKLTSEHTLYNAHIDGEETPIVTGNWHPDRDVCRALQARGKTGGVDFWWLGEDCAPQIVVDLINAREGEHQ